MFLMINNIFDEWNIVKKNINNKKSRKWFHERDVFWAKVGINVGDEENGKGQESIRPLVIIAKFNHSLCWPIPLSTKNKSNKFYIPFTLNGITRSAIISQMKLFDAKRFESKIGKISKEDYQKIKVAIQEILND